MAIYQDQDTALDIRHFVNRRLVEIGMSKSELARRVHNRGVCSTETVMRYLRGATETSSQVLSFIFSETGIVVSASINV